MKIYECVMYIIFDIGIDLKYLKVLQKEKPHFTHAGWLEVSKLHGEFYSVTAKLEYLFLSHVTFSLLCC